ncbi:MAG: tetratricopeptide repeat protein [Gammaproteobacteria bacterium]|nr:tetratricopeptide repeat protein [Gammaproteobacteria bacterium]MDH3768871.1 tetratricopeptide repeat protein [Gammaproteobacteria bacterium]
MSLLNELKQRNVFRVAATYALMSWLLLQVVDTVVPLTGLPEWTGRFVLLLLAVGFPVALFFSWAYELTPEGIKREQDVDRSTAANGISRKIDYAIIALLSIALVYLVATRNRTAPWEEAVEPSIAQSAPDVADNRSIAVLPFENRSALKEDAFFTDGIHDDLLTHLARIGSLKVISRTSMLRYRGSDKSLPQIARELGVATILEGGVQRAGNTVRINVQLIDAVTDEHIWANNYDRELTAQNIFSIQTEIATAITKSLQATLSPQEQARMATAPTTNMKAAEEYMLGRQLMENRTSAGLAGAVEQFKRATQHDPEFAQAYVSLADAYQLQMYYSGAAQNEVQPLARNAIDKALNLDDRLGEAYVSLAFLIDGTDGKAGEEAYRKGLQLRPNYARGHHWYGTFLNSRGRLDEARAELEKAVELDPMSPIIQSSLGTLYQRMGLVKETLERLNHAIEIDPGFAKGYADIAEFEFFVRGRSDAALLAIQEYRRLDPGTPRAFALPGLVYLYLGDPDTAQVWIKKANELGPDAIVPLYAAALLNLYRGEIDDAAVNLQRVLAIVPNYVPAITRLCDVDIQRGDLDGALKRYERFFPGLSEDELVVNRRNYAPAVGLAQVLQKSGDAQRADALLSRALTVFSTIPVSVRTSEGVGLLETEIFALQDRSQDALAKLRETINRGSPEEWWYHEKHNPRIASIRNEPQFQDMMRDIHSQLTKQLTRIRGMEQDGQITSATTLITAQSR